jgi:hypothetical protein
MKVISRLRSFFKTKAEACAKAGIRISPKTNKDRLVNLGNVFNGFNFMTPNPSGGLEVSQLNLFNIK